MSHQPIANNGSNEKAAISLKPKILVVDDSRLVRVSISKLLGHEFAIIEAEDGEDGWDKILQHSDLHVVMTDAGMPKLDGFQLIERVRRCNDKRISQLPLIMITGAEEEQVSIRERAFDLGASDFIIKPFDKTQLIARVRSYIRQDTLQRDLQLTSETLKDHSNIDPLTKLHNHGYFIDRFTQDMSLAKRHNHELSLIGLRIDSYSDIVHRFGVNTAQEVLIHVVESLLPLIRTEDSLARTGDCEFSLITPATDRMSAAYVCERLRAKIDSEPYSKTVISLPLSISLGLININRDKPDSAESALAQVRSRIKYAQALGGNRMVAQASPATPSALFDTKRITHEVAPVSESISRGLDVDKAPRAESQSPKIADSLLNNAAIVEQEAYLEAQPEIVEEAHFDNEAVIIEEVDDEFELESEQISDRGDEDGIEHQDVRNAVSENVESVKNENADRNKVVAYEALATQNDEIEISIHDSIADDAGQKEDENTVDALSSPPPASTANKDATAQQDPAIAFSVEMMDLLQLGLSIIPLLKQVNRSLHLDINQHIEAIEKRLRERKP